LRIYIAAKGGTVSMTKAFNDTFLKAARGEKTSYTPVWYMRQAGRSQPEYRKLKEKYSLFEITHQPELCAYVTRLPVEQYDVDAAILYKDIMTPLPSLGVNVEIKAGIGPVIENPIRSYQDVERLGEIHPEDDIPYVLDTIRLLTNEQLSVPLIGFAGAPFTLASYMIEGGPSKNYHKTKAFMYGEPLAWHLINEWNDLPVDVIGLDWRMEVKEARTLGVTKTLQGNLDPSLLMAPWEQIEKRAKEILDQGLAQPSHIFNLGHGVFPDVNPDTLKRLTAFVHDYTKNEKSSI
jgi:uroporphyrinogen-III decarboxylase